MSPKHIETVRRILGLSLAERIQPKCRDEFFLAVYNGLEEARYFFTKWVQEDVYFNQPLEELLIEAFVKKVEERVLTVLLDQLEGKPLRNGLLLSEKGGLVFYAKRVAKSENFVKEARRDATYDEIAKDSSKIKDGEVRKIKDGKKTDRAFLIFALPVDPDKGQVYDSEGEVIRPQEHLRQGISPNHVSIVVHTHMFARLNDTQKAIVILSRLMSAKPSGKEFRAMARAAGVSAPRCGERVDAVLNLRTDERRDLTRAEIAKIVGFSEKGLRDMFKAEPLCNFDSDEAANAVYGLLTRKQAA
jgi:hypothetical protein